MKTSPPSATFRLKFARNVALLTLSLLALLAIFVQRGSAQGGGSDYSVEVDDAGFAPADLNIVPGDRVVWENVSDSMTHTIVFEDGTVSGVLLTSSPNKKYERVFTETGIYTYTDGSAQTHVGVVRVSGSAPVDGMELSVNVRRDQPLVPGALVTYHVAYENHSSLTPTVNSVLTVTLPVSAVLQSSRRNGLTLAPDQQLGSVLVYLLGTLPAKAEGSIDLVIQLPADPDPAADLALSAQITADNVPVHFGGWSEDSASVATPRLTIGLRPDEHEDGFGANGIVSYTLTYANQADDAAAHDVTITLQLPVSVTLDGVTYRTEGGTPLTPTQLGSSGDVQFLLALLPPDAGGRINLRLGTPVSATRLPITATIDSSDVLPVGAAEDDRSAHDDVVLPPDASDLFVRLTSSSLLEVGSEISYRLEYGNGGGREADGVRLRLVLPTGVLSPTYDVTPTRILGRIVTWNFDSLDARSTGQPYTVRGIIGDVSELSATASITGLLSAGETEAESVDNEVQTIEYVVPLYRPTIYRPQGATTNPLPLFVGAGTPGATVSLWLSGTQAVAGHLIATTTVGPLGSWTLTPTVPFANGWQWVTATQQLDTRTSGIAGAKFMVTDTLRIDPNSVTRDGVALGGLNTSLGWAPFHTYKMGVSVPACAAVISPTLQARLFNGNGQMTGFRDFAATYNLGQHVEFDMLPAFGVAPFQLWLDYYCQPPLGQGGVPTPTMFHAVDCYDNPWCTDDPPSPPELCEDCAPGRPPLPTATDPDGLVYDGAAVRNGATLAQSILVDAWVTATRQVAPGVWVPWNGLQYNQVNPQFTDSAYPDNVLTPGYYSFLVPPGSYRIQVNAPGFMPYESVIVQVANTPVTLDIPMERVVGALRATTPLAVPPPDPGTTRIFLPVMSGS